MTTETKTNKPSEEAVDGRDTIVTGAVSPTPADSGDTADMNESLKSKPIRYNCTPATTYTKTKSGEMLNSYRIVGDKLPKVGDLVRLTWGKTEFKGTVVEFTSDDVLRLRKSK